MRRVFQLPRTNRRGDATRENAGGRPQGAGHRRSRCGVGQPDRQTNWRDVGCGEVPVRRRGRLWAAVSDALRSDGPTCSSCRFGAPLERVAAYRTFMTAPTTRDNRALRAALPATLPTRSSTAPTNRPRRRTGTSPHPTSRQFVWRSGWPTPQGIAGGQRL